MLYECSHAGENETHILITNSLFSCVNDQGFFHPLTCHDSVNS